MASYWGSRKNLAYYKVCEALIRVWIPETRETRLLDVGSGLRLGCRFLERLPYQITSIDQGKPIVRFDHVRAVNADFLEWEPDGRYDFVSAMQVVEHVVDPKAFCQKLFACGGHVLISVPDRWPAGEDPSHRHDPVDEEKLFSWTCRRPTVLCHCHDAKTSRLIALYENSSVAREKLL